MKNNEYFMKEALKEAQKGLNKTFPNPAVGCVIVKNGKIIAKGYHKKAGEPHAEIEALKQIDFNAEDCDIYVTLEPCNHYGKTPPCTEAIIKSGAKRVFVSVKDPNPRVNGSGIKRLRESGIEVETDILKEEGEEVLKYFSFQIKNKLPFITLKAALSLNGFINKRKGERTFLTGKEAYEYTLELRKRHDAVLVGGNTVFTDNPRLRGVKKIILTNRNLPNELNIFKSDDEVFIYKRQNIEEILKDLYSKGIGSILVEGGGEIFNQFIERGFFNEIVVYYAPLLFSLSNERTPFYDGLKDISDLEIKEVKKLGNDVMIIYRRRGK